MIDNSRRNISQPQNHKGFTLIELMITVAIIALLAGIAYPSYRDQVSTSKRADAMGGMLELAQFMERTFTETGTYKPGGSNPALPAMISGDKDYNFALVNASTTATAYLLQATPTGGQSDDRCGNLTLSSTGVKGVSKGTVNSCWKSP